MRPALQPSYGPGFISPNNARRSADDLKKSREAHSKIPRFAAGGHKYLRQTEFLRVQSIHFLHHQALERNR